MKKSISFAEHPIFTLEIARDETSFGSVDAICGYLRACIESHRAAVFIADFDHHTHIRSLPEGQIAEDIRAARNLVFCFGIALPTPQALAVRPRSIGVAETRQGFLVTFMEPPMPVANAAMEDWVCGLCDRQTALA